MPVGPRRALVLLHALAYYIQPPTDLLRLALKQAHILRLKKKFIYLPDTDYALQKLIFHYDVVALTAQFVHNIYRVWSGRGCPANEEEDEEGENDSDIEDGEMDANESDSDDI
ncbi:hypothetical protein CVT26_002413 [Gymnopilus dilepis]|uniref:Uncharacterized protein n=1 Tax=Gymnopilus dilepis TaxID=231916 RepID=A0A409Y3E9_9AGAR|nr:hypothetical protein CVT26_002413 [Gymnopilus dilepis]